MNLSDTSNFVSKLSYQKVRNAQKVWWSYYQSKSKKIPNQKGLPFNISFEPTTSCNLRCPECPSGLRSFTRVTGMLNDQFFKKTIDELEQHLIYLYLYFQGEPYLNPSFLDLVEYASNRDIYTVTSTNAHYLTDDNARRTVESGLDRIIISIDGTSQETYEQYRIGGKLDKVLEGTANLVTWKKKLASKTPHIIFQFLVVGPNEHEIPEVYRLAKQYGVDEVTLKTAQIYDFENGSPLIPKQEHYSRYYLNGDGKYHIKNQLENNCWKLWHSCVITWDGKVVPCCFDKDAKYQMGDLQQLSFKEIWWSEAYQQFRQSIFKSRSEIDICKNCTEGLKVWA